MGFKQLDNPANAAGQPWGGSFWTDWIYRAWWNMINLFSVSASSGSAGIATMSGGTVTIPTNKAIQNCPIQFNYFGNPSNPGYLYLANINPGVSIQINSTNAATSGSISWMIINLTNS